MGHLRTVFATQVWIIDNALDEATNEAIAQAIYDWRDTDASFTGERYENGYTSYGNKMGGPDGDGRRDRECFDDPRFAPLARAVCEQAHAFMTAVGMIQPDERTIMIDNMFCNINGKGSQHRPHRHPGSEISGVYYVRTPPDSGVFTLHSPLEPCMMSVGFDHFDEEAPWVEMQRTLPPVARQLRLFPSWLLHEVEVQKGGEDRLSVAFNCHIETLEDIHAGRAREVALGKARAGTAP